MSVSMVISILSMLSRLEEEAAFNNSSFTYFVDFIYRNSAPQKVSPRPMKARTYEEKNTDVNKDTSPSKSNTYGIVSRAWKSIATVPRPSAVKVNVSTSQ